MFFNTLVGICQNIAYKKVSAGDTAVSASGHFVKNSARACGIQIDICSNSTNVRKIGKSLSRGITRHSISGCVSRISDWEHLNPQFPVRPPCVVFPLQLFVVHRRYGLAPEHRPPHSAWRTAQRQTGGAFFRCALRALRFANTPGARRPGLPQGQIPKIRPDPPVSTPPA